MRRWRVRSEGRAMDSVRSHGRRRSHRSLPGTGNGEVTIVEYGGVRMPLVRPSLSGGEAAVARLRGTACASRSGTIRSRKCTRMRELAAEASEAAGAQHKFWPMYDLLFEHQLHLEAEGSAPLRRAARARSGAVRLRAQRSGLPATVNEHVAERPSERRARDAHLLREWRLDRCLVRHGPSVRGCEESSVRALQRANAIS